MAERGTQWSSTGAVVVQFYSQMERLCQPIVQSPSPGVASHQLHNGVARAPRTFRPAMRAWAARPISVVRQFGRERRSRRGQEGRPAVRLRAQGSEPEHQAREEHAQANGDVHAPHVAMIGAHPGGDTRTAARGALGGLGWRA